MISFQQTSILTRTHRVTYLLWESRRQRCIAIDERFRIGGRLWRRIIEKDRKRHLGWGECNYQFTLRCRCAKRCAFLRQNKK